jgi:hypothetical protein
MLLSLACGFTGSPAFAAPQHVNMGSAWLVEKPGDEGFIVVEAVPANRANPGTLAVQAVRAAVNVHKPVGLAHSGKGRGFDPFPMNKPDGANRTGPGHPGFAFQIVVFASFPQAGSAAPGSWRKKEAVSKVEKARADNDKNQHLKI